jgi:hypothetical protein
MATTTKALYRGAPGTTLATLYTVPSATTAIVTNIVVGNTAGTAGTFTINMGGVGMATTVSIAANSIAVIDMKQVLAATNTITGNGSTASITFHISGVEIA